MPSDISKSVAKHWKEGRGDWHTASYFSAKELIDVKDDPIKFRDCLSMKTYKGYLASGKKMIPEEEDEFRWGRHIDGKIISNSEMERIIALSAFWDGVIYYTDIISDSDLKIDMHLWNNIVPAMLKVEPNPEKIRIVFWFDN